MLNLHCSISQVYVACGGGGSCKFDAVATAKVEIWRGHNAVWGSEDVNGSNVELYLFQSEHRREKCRQWSRFLGFHPSGDARIGGGGDVDDALGDGVGDIRLSKKSQGARRLVFATTAKSPGASPRVS